MKLWQKICICVVVLFIIGFDVSAWLIIEKSTAVLIEQETEIALTDQRLMESSLAERLTAAQKDYETLNADNLAFLIQPYAQYYADQRTYFKVYLDDKLVYGSFKAGSDFDTQVSAGQTQYALVEITGTPYLRIASRMDEPFSNIRIVYLKNEQQIQDYRSQISRYCVTVSVIVSVALAAVVVALLLRLTSPLRKLNEAAREISAGDYHREVKVDSRDEVGELAESFNVMSEHVRAHIEELSKLTEAKQRFIDDLAHELRTPLTAIVGYGEALRSAQLDDEERDMALNYIVSQGERIQNLSTKLIDLAWLGSSQIDPEEVDLAEVFRSVEASVRGRCEEKAVELTWEVEVDTLCTDRDLLETMLQNLVENALRAVAACGKINLTALRTGERIVLRVEDNGIGMGPGELEKITEPFYRVDASRSRKQGGVGLGLSLCSAIAGSLGARLRFESAPGKGTRVNIEFTTS